MTDGQLLARVALLERLGLLALAGLLLLLGAALLPAGRAQTTAIVLALVAVLPAFVYLVLLAQWHWKGRYRGAHSDLWGGILLLETSGWMKLVYLFRHILPDARGTGRYVRPASSAQAA